MADILDRFLHLLGTKRSAEEKVAITLLFVKHFSRSQIENSNQDKCKRIIQSIGVEFVLQIICNSEPVLKRCGLNMLKLAANIIPEDLKSFIPAVLVLIVREKDFDSVAEIIDVVHSYVLSASENAKQHFQLDAFRKDIEKIVEDTLLFVYNQETSKKNVDTSKKSIEESPLILKCILQNILLVLIEYDIHCISEKSSKLLQNLFFLKLHRANSDTELSLWWAIFTQYFCLLRELTWMVSVPDVSPSSSAATDVKFDNKWFLSVLTSQICTCLHMSFEEILCLLTEVGGEVHCNYLLPKRLLSEGGVSEVGRPTRSVEGDRMKSRESFCISMLTIGCDYLNRLLELMTSEDEECAWISVVQSAAFSIHVQKLVLPTLKEMSTFVVDIISAFQRSSYKSDPVRASSIVAIVNQCIILLSKWCKGDVALLPVVLECLDPVISLENVWLGYPVVQKICNSPHSSLQTVFSQLSKSERSNLMILNSFHWIYEQHRYTVEKLGYDDAGYDVDRYITNVLGYYSSCDGLLLCITTISDCILSDYEYGKPEDYVYVDKQFYSLIEKLAMKNGFLFRLLQISKFLLRSSSFFITETKCSSLPENEVFEVSPLISDIDEMVCRRLVSVVGLLVKILYYHKYALLLLLKSENADEAIVHCFSQVKSAKDIKLQPSVDEERMSVRDITELLHCIEFAGDIRVLSDDLDIYLRLFCEFCKVINVCK